MSRSKNQELSSWKVVLVRLRREETTWRGISLSMVDHATYTEAILCNAMVLNDLSNRYEGCGCKRDHVMWALNCVQIDVSLLASFLSDAILLFRSDWIGYKGVASYIAFKRQLTKEYPFAGVLLGPISRAIDLHFANPSPITFYPVYQFLSFMTHLTLNDLNMAAELEKEFIDNEKSISQHHLPDDFIDRMNFIMKEWFRDFRIDSQEFMPSHGPGAVAEFSGDKTLYSKYQRIAPDALIKYVFRKHSDLDATEFAPLKDLPDTSREASVVFVPKSMKTQRVISKEPATLMYYQQGVDRCIRKYIARHKYLSQHLDLNDQSVQREAALRAANTRQFATVDLSAASDSVSYELVKRVFRGTALYPYLVALRSRTVRLPSGEVMVTAKYAPMGSALCFPIESLIFACIAECTVRYVRYDTSASMREYHIYGDDIIVPDQCLADLTIFLNWCGFRLNLSKTYGGDHRFRESCGCDAYDGTDVTCMKIGRKFSSRQVNPRSPGIFAGLITMANTCLHYEFQLLRRYLVDKLLHDTGFSPLFSGDVNLGLYSPNATNFHLPKRVNRDYQRDEVLAAGVFSVRSQLGTLKWDSKKRKYRESDPLPLADDIRYFEWLRVTSNRHGDPDDPNFCPRVSVGNVGTYLTKRWMLPWSHFDIDGIEDTGMIPCSVPLVTKRDQFPS